MLFLCFILLFLDGVYLDGANGAATRFRWVRAPTSDELTQLVHTIARRIGRFLEKEGLLEQLPKTAIWPQMRWMKTR